MHRDPFSIVSMDKTRWRNEPRTLRAFFEMEHAVADDVHVLRDADGRICETVGVVGLVDDVSRWIEVNHFDSIGETPFSFLDSTLSVAGMSRTAAIAGLLVCTSKNEAFGGYSFRRLRVWPLFT